MGSEGTAPTIHDYTAERRELQIFKEYEEMEEMMVVLPKEKFLDLEEFF
jgi:hypothetical protein